MCKRFEDFEKEAQQYRQILINYRDKGEVFTDPNFHPRKKIPESQVDLNSVEWIRVDDIYPAPLFKQDLIQPDFVNQGAIGDCYFVSALVQLSTQPYLVPYLFDHKSELYLDTEPDSINLKCGAVVIYFHAFGRKTPVLIDTLLPCHIYSKEPIFSRPINKTKSAWFCLVEKAYAKLYESYSEIVSGDLTQSIYSLYGYYSSMKSMASIKDSKKMSAYEALKKHKEEGAIMGTSIHVDRLNGITEDDVNKKGLVPIHSYLILKLKQFEGKNFVCLRNPWGEKEWNGDWSDESDLWTPQMKEEFGLKVGNDGTFWMIESDFFKYFSDISITKPIPPNWHKKHIEYKMKPLLDLNESIKFDELPGICFKINEDENSDKNNKILIISERRHKLLDDDGNVNNEPPPFCCPVGLKSFLSIFLSTPSRVLSVHDCASRNKSVSRYCLFHRNGLCSYSEDVYVTFFCELDFDLYDEKNPEVLMPEDRRSGVFYNFSMLNKGNLKTLKKSEQNEDQSNSQENVNGQNNSPEISKNQNDSNGQINSPENAVNNSNDNNNDHENSPENNEGQNDSPKPNDAQNNLQQKSQINAPDKVKSKQTKTIQKNEQNKRKITKTLNSNENKQIRKQPVLHNKTKLSKNEPEKVQNDQDNQLNSRSLRKMFNSIRDNVFQSYFPDS